MKKPITLFVYHIMNNLKPQQTTRAEVEAALLHYCRFHLKPEDLAAVPELKRFISKENGYKK